MRLTAALVAAALTLTAAPMLPAMAAMAPCDATTIPDLIARKAGGGLVVVPPGRYCGDVMLPMGYDLVSAEGAERTTIVGGTYGVHMDHGEFMSVIGFTITGAALDGVYQDDAHHGGAITVAANVIHGNGRWGVNLLTMHDIIVERNRFLGNGMGGLRLAGEHMMGMSFQVYENMFRGEPVAMLYEEGMNGRFVRNLVHGGGTGVKAVAWGGLRLYQNMFERTAVAVDLAADCVGGVPMPVSEVSIFDNHFRNNGLGVVSRGGMDGCSEPWGVMVLKLEHNQFQGHATYAVDHMASLHMGMATARYNYWGSDLGPSPGMNRLPGLGDMVSLGVDFGLWCLKATCPPHLGSM